MSLQRTHVLLEPEQQSALTEIARREHRSVSDVTREIVQQGIALRKQQLEVEFQRRQAALENARQARQAIVAERAGKPLEVDIAALIQTMREERDEQILANVIQRGD